MILPNNLADLLLPWYQANRRPLPWRDTTDPYRVWLSEIMLQQTRAETVKVYYLRFLQVLPDIRALAECPEDKLLKLWEGLGYYNRARNLQKAAKLIMEEFDGSFPREPELVRSLPGIGAYTAGAICSICFGFPIPAVDGNVLRVCSRLTASLEDVSLVPNKRAIADALLPCFPAKDCGNFNQALMELGATICIPGGEPRCGACPLASICLSRPDELWREIPVLSLKKARQREEIAVFLLRHADRFALQKRPGTGLLAGLWEYPSLTGLLTPQQALDQAAAWGCAPMALLKITEREHIFTHREWHMTGYEISCAVMSDRFCWAGLKELDEIYSLPSAFRKFDDIVIVDRAQRGGKEN